MNIILYVLDSLRADHLSCYGYPRETSPHIDQITADGVLFENAFSQTTWTRPSAASILTSTYPSVNGLIYRTDSFPSQLTTLPEMLKAEGLLTAGVSTIGNVSSVLGFAKGFDRFVDLYKRKELYRTRDFISTAKERLTHEDVNQIVLPLAEDMNVAALSWLEAHRKQDQFLLLWAIDTHDPYNPPPGFDKFCDPHYRGKIDGSRDSLRHARSKEDVQRLVDLYDSEIFYNDYCIGQLVDHLKEIDAYEDTLLILTSDHGEAFHDDHGNVGHGYIPYEELIHVPLIIKFPNSEHRKTRVSQLVQLIDLMPTILEIIGFSGKDKVSPMQGKSILPTLDGKPIHKYVYSETSPTEIQDYHRSIRSTHWKYIMTESSGLRFREAIRNYWKLFSNRAFLRELLINPVYYLRKQLGAEPEMLFNLVEDPQEQYNAKDQHPEAAQKCQEALTQWCEKNKVFSNENGTFSTETSKIDLKTERHLQKLGYID